jgi:hypothetical protein
VEIDLEGIVIIVGNYGSGKTEVTVNLALARKQAGIDVRVADLDLVNPYFRTREAKAVLARRGIEVVLPPEQYLHADLPILSPAVAGLIRRPSRLTLLDVGGDGVGATVLSALADPLAGRPVRMLQVVNPFRPFTDTIEGCLRIRRDIEHASRLTVNGLIGNPNLIDETTPEDVYAGYEFLTALSKSSALPVCFVTVPQTLAEQVDGARLDCPVLCIDRQLVPPWKRRPAEGGVAEPGGAGGEAARPKRKEK